MSFIDILADRIYKAFPQNRISRPWRRSFADAHEIMLDFMMLRRLAGETTRHDMAVVEVSRGIARKRWNQALIL